ncbi:hypothetical protein CIB95_13525 [Lottiidibacillus patelloidae]|uniref:YitT family protein n=1 Tax=Lottiidibacillus patelloidae TaxID=2670334 RepID=A0A263BR18_9BACI|nr:hypothetical protein [Lottiidibacillus patelloidae]OZM56124.1 hypothetical protein CIB95_13525 [Lottiidibacillus patelloidae]
MKYLILIFACACIAFGITMTIQVSELGLEPWGAAHIGLANYVYTVGTWTAIYQLLLLSINFFLDKKLPRFGTLLCILCLGPFIDFFIYLNITPLTDSYFLKWLQFFLGIIIACFGAALSITTNLGSSPKTQCYVTIAAAFQIPLFMAKMLLELTGLLTALIVGGPIFIGTLFFVFLTGPIVQWQYTQLQRVKGKFSNLKQLKKRTA